MTSGPETRRPTPQSSTALEPNRDPELWQGAVTWTVEEGWWQAQRLLPELEQFAYAPDLYDKSRAPAGVRLRPSTAASTLELQLRSGSESVIDLVIDNMLVERQPVVVGEQAITFDLPSARGSVTEVWLPQSGPVQIRSVVALGGSTCVPTAPRRRWLTYGSSITQCTAAAGPSETWPAVAARSLDWDLTCLGFGGQCHLDHAVIETIDTVEADVISICLGINVYGGNSFSQRSWPGRVAEFITRVRAGHPHAELFAITPIWSPAREEIANGAGMTLSGYRHDVTRVAEDLRAAGDDHLHVIDGLSILGNAEEGMLPDGLHPDADGYRMMGQRIGAVLGEWQAAQSSL